MIANGRAVREIFEFEKSSDLIGRELSLSLRMRFWRIIDTNKILHSKQNKSTHRWTTFPSKLKKPHFGGILGPNPQFWAKREFSRKIGLCHFFAFMDP